MADYQAYLKNSISCGRRKRTQSEPKRNVAGRVCFYVCFILFFIAIRNAHSERDAFYLLFPPPSPFFNFRHRRDIVMSIPYLLTQ